MVILYFLWALLCSGFDGYAQFCMDLYTVFQFFVMRRVKSSPLRVGNRKRAGLARALILLTRARAAPELVVTPHEPEPSWPCSGSSHFALLATRPYRAAISLTRPQHSIGHLHEIDQLPLPRLLILLQHHDPWQAQPTGACSNQRPLWKHQP